MKPPAEITKYRGYEIEVYERMFVVIAPNGDFQRFRSMSSVRSWVSRHRRDKIGG